MVQPASLEDALTSLSDVQRQAVCRDDGALLVLAGPGFREDAGSDNPHSPLAK